MRRTFLIYLSVVISAQALLGQEKPRAVAGGTARTAGLGGGPTNPYILDYTDVFVNPANAVVYPDLLYSDVGYNFLAYRASGQYIGWTLGLGDLAVGIAVGRREGPMFAENSYGTGTFVASDYMKIALDGFLGAGGWGVSQEPLPPLQFYGAYNAGAMKVGLGIYRSSWSRTDDNAGAVGADQKLTASNNQTGFKIGTLVDIGTGFHVDASVNFRFNGSDADFTDSTPPPGGVSSVSYSASGTEFGVNGRVLFSLTPRLTLVPQVRFSSFGYKPDVSQNPAPATAFATNDYGRSEFEVGVAANTRLESGFVSVGLSIQSVSVKNNTTPGGGQTTNNKVSWFDLPKLNMGAELGLTSWLTGRVGYFKRFSTMTTTTEPPGAAKSETSTSVEAGYVPNLGLTNIDQQLSVGLGILIDRIALDGYVGDRILAAGPWFLSGIAQNIFGVLSLSYKF